MFRTIAFLGAAGAMALLAGCQPAATNAAGGAVQPASLFGGSGGMSTFTDPTENAFTVSTPQGWAVKGGVQRQSPVMAKQWLTATSPDGVTTISLGDPSIPPFTLPSQMHAVGSTVQNAAGAQSPVEAYETGVQFAADYAQRVFGQGCQLQAAGTQAEPALAQEAQAQEAQLAASLGVPAPNIQYDGGSALFTCQAGGVSKVFGVIDVTSLQSLPMGGGGWGVPIIIVYSTTAANQAQTDQMARSMHQSFKPNPQWQAQMLTADKQALAQQQQQGQQEEAALTRQENAESGALNAQMQSADARLNAEHAATMNQLNAQGAARNQAFAQHMYDKGTGQQSEMRYINNQTCIRWYDAAHTRCAATAQN